MLYIISMYYFLLKIYKTNKLFLQDKYIAKIIYLCYNVFIIYIERKIVMEEKYVTEQNAPVSLQKQQETYPAVQDTAQINVQNTKFCKHCGGKIPADAVLCTLCGRQVEDISQQVSPQPQIIINNDNINTNTNTNMVGVPGMRAKNKWVSVLLCLFLGVFGVHRFYEGKIGTGLIYLLTFGLFGVGAPIDILIMPFKPNPYYV